MLQLVAIGLTFFHVFHLVEACPANDLNPSAKLQRTVRVVQVAGSRTREDIVDAVVARHRLQVADSRIRDIRVLLARDYCLHVHRRLIYLHLDLDLLAKGRSHNGGVDLDTGTSLGVGGCGRRS